MNTPFRQASGFCEARMTRVTSGLGSGATSHCAGTNVNEDYREPWRYICSEQSGFRVAAAHLLHCKLPSSSCPSIDLGRWGIHSFVETDLVSVPCTSFIVSLVLFYGFNSRKRCEVLSTSDMVVDSMSEHVIDVARHGGTETLVGPIPRPTIGGSFMIHENVMKGKHGVSNLSNHFEPLLVN